MTPARWSIAVLLTSLGLLAMTAPTASAVNCDTLPNLTDAEGWEWNFADDAAAYAAAHDGSQDAGQAYYDTDFNSYYSTTDGSDCPLEDGGREIAYPVQDVSGLEFSVKIFVPTGDP